MQSALVIEDNRATAAALAGYLSEAFLNIKVHQCHGLAEARQQLRQVHPDIVLLDIGLPDGRGTELLLDGSLACVAQVVVITIFDDDEHIFAALRAGAQGYLLKDETDVRFIEALKGILAGRPPLSPAIAQRMMDYFRPRPKADLLSPRESELLEHIAAGHSVRRAAEQMGVTANTASGYLKTIYQKLQVNSRATMTRKAVELGLLSP